MEYNTNSDTTPVESRKKQMYTQEHADALRAENERLREALKYIVDRGYTGASYIAQQALNEVTK